MLCKCSDRDYDEKYDDRCDMCGELYHGQYLGPYCEYGSYVEEMHFGNICDCPYVCTSCAQKKDLNDNMIFYVMIILNLFTTGIIMSLVNLGLIENCIRPLFVSFMLTVPVSFMITSLIKKS